MERTYCGWCGGVGRLWDMEDSWTCPQCDNEPVLPYIGMEELEKIRSELKPASTTTKVEVATSLSSNNSDRVYLERNQCVALIARMALAMGFKAGIAKTAIEGWEPEWHNCVYINLPSGQVSWHYHDREIYLFDDLPAYNTAWDGHDTPTKYERVGKAFQVGVVHTHPAVEDILGSCVYEMSRTQALLHHSSGRQTLIEKIIALVPRLARRSQQGRESAQLSERVVAIAKEHSTGFAKSFWKR